MKMLVSGSCGLVGSEAVKYFTEKGWEVIGIDANNRSQFFGTASKTPEYVLDIRDMAGMKKLFKEHSFDAIIHTAGQPSHDYSKDNVLEDFTINAMGTVILLELARTYCPKAVFVHCSTDKIYGWGMRRTDLEERETRWHSDYLYDEHTPFEPPFSPFGVSKLTADFYVQEYAAQGWLTTGIFRMGCITGRNHEGAEQHGFLAYLAKCIKEGKTYNIYGYKGKQVRDQIHAYDLVSAFDHFIQKPLAGAVYNIGGGPERSVSVLEAITLIQNKLGLGKIDPETNFWRETFRFEKERFGDRQWDVHDVSKFRKDFPEWDYKYSLDDIITDLCKK